MSKDVKFVNMNSELVAVSALNHECPFIRFYSKDYNKFLRHVFCLIQRLAALLYSIIDNTDMLAVTSKPTPLEEH